MSDRLRVVLADDHDVVRAGLKALIESEGDIAVVGEAATVAGAIAAVADHRPDLAVLDVQMPDGSGVEACREIRSRYKKTQVLMLTAFADEQAFVAAVMAGAAGYLLKRIKGAELLDSVRRAAAGESLLDPELTERLRVRVEEADHGDPLLARLSPQERRVLDLIAQGYTNREIADEIFLAEKTVKNYVSNLLAKLEMSNRSEAAAYASRLAAMVGEPEEPGAPEA